MDYLRKVFQAPDSVTGPAKPRPPTPGFNFPPGAYIPDYKIYKVENSPEFLEVQRRLAARGLKSHWLRNSVWRYDPKLWGTEAWKVLDFFTMGWRYYVPMLMVTAVYEFVLKEDDHGHGHGHDKKQH